MADKIIAHHSATGASLYALVRNSAGDVWDGAAFVPYLTADRLGYVLPLAEQGTASQCYVTDFPPAPGGLCNVAVYVRDGAEPAEGDTLARSYGVEWDDTAFSVIKEAVSGAGAIRGTLGVPANGSMSDDIAAVYAVTSIGAATVDNLLDWFRLVLRKDPDVATGFAAALAVINADLGNGPGTYNPATDSLQAQADAVWTRQE